MNKISGLSLKERSRRCKSVNSKKCLNAGHLFRLKIIQSHVYHRIQNFFPQSEKEADFIYTKNKKEHNRKLLR